MTTEKPGRLASPLTEELGALLEDAASDCLSELAGVDTYDVNLRDHPKAWAAIEAFAATVRAVTWQPIATAPKDRPILLGYAPHPRMVGDRRVYEGRWHEEQQTWTSVNGFLVHTGATHWQPLPAPTESA